MSNQPALNYDELNKLFRKTKGQLFFKQGAGFLGPLICNLDFAWDEHIPTACTNGLIIKFNPHFYLKMSEAMRVTVLAHEAWHVGMMHMVRVAGRNPQLWNIAADYVINNILHNEGYVFDDKNHLYDPKYGNMTTEQVYDLLDKQFSNSPSSAPQCALSGGSGDIEKPGAGEEASPAQIAEVIHKVMSAKAAAKLSGMDPDNIPGEIETVIKDFLRPILPWKTLLANFFTALSYTDRSYRRPNRRYSDPLMPGRIGQNGLEHIVYYLDISGSVSDFEIKRFNSEVKHIKDVYNPEKLTLVTFDTHVRNVYEFTKDEPFEKVVVIGRGGTDLEDVVKHANKLKPTAVIIFTDLEVRIPITKITSPLIWVCTNNPRKTVPYGKLIYLNEKPT